MGSNIIEFAVGFVFLAAAVSAVSMTLAESFIFSSYRRFVNGWFGEKFGHLAHCAYCTSHWVAALALVLCDVLINVSGWTLVNCLVTWFALVGVAGVFSAAIKKAHFTLGRP